MNNLPLRVSTVNIYIPRSGPNPMNVPMGLLHFSNPPPFASMTDQCLISSRTTPKGLNIPQTPFSLGSDSLYSGDNHIPNLHSGQHISCRAQCPLTTGTSPNKSRDATHQAPVGELAFAILRYQRQSIRREASKAAMQGLHQKRCRLEQRVLRERTQGAR